MSDGFDIGPHGGPFAGGLAVLSAAISAGIARVFASRDARDAAREVSRQLADQSTRLVVLEKLLEWISKGLEEQNALRERVALVEASASAAHARQDRLERSNKNG